MFWHFINKGYVLYLIYIIYKFQVFVIYNINNQFISQQFFEFGYKIKVLRLYFLLKFSTFNIILIYSNEICQRGIVDSHWTLSCCRNTWNSTSFERIFFKTWMRKRHSWYLYGTHRKFSTFFWNTRLFTDNTVIISWFLKKL